MRLTLLLLYCHVIFIKESGNEIDIASALLSCDLIKQSGNEIDIVSAILSCEFH